MPSGIELSRAAESALDRLAARYGEHLRLAEPAPAGRGRHAPRSEQTREANAVVDMVAVAEAFSIDRLLAGWPGTSSARTRTWKKREMAWQAVGADLTATMSWPALMGFVEVRNALQHGLGRLTDEQLGRRDQTRPRIAASGVDLNGDRVTVRDADVDRCYQTCRGFVLQADHIAFCAI